MKNFVPLDPDATVSQKKWAVVHVPGRSRNRFAASCLRIVANQEEALSQCAPLQRQFAANVMGPSKSSEGHSIYYLIRWLSVQP